MLSRLATALIVLVVFLSAGCASAPRPVSAAKVAEVREALGRVDLTKIGSTTPRAAAAQPAIAATAATQDQLLDEAFTKMVGVCQGSMGGLANRAERLSNWQIIVAAVGALVGGVAVPALTTANAAANATWISALGGVSGVANAAQQAMVSVGYTPQDQLKIRENAIKEWKTAVGNYFDASKSYDMRKASVQEALTACIMFSITIPEPASN